MSLILTNRQSRAINRAQLKRVAQVVMAAEGCEPETELSVAIGDDEWIQELNRKYTRKNRPTDVLAFPQDITPAGAGRLLGDVAVSAETAERQAQEAGHDLMAELSLLLTHGILHLTGWTDETPIKRRRMMARAQELLSQADRGREHPETTRGGKTPLSR